MFAGAIGASCAEALGAVLGVERLPWSALEVDTDAENSEDPAAPHLDSVIVYPTIFGGDLAIRYRYRATVRQAQDRSLVSSAIRGNVTYKVGEVMVVVPDSPGPVGLREGAGPGRQGSLPGESDTLVGRHLSALNLHWPDETLATFDADCTVEDVALGRVFKGRAGVADYYRSWWNAFDLTVTAAQHHHIGTDTVIVEERYIGTHEGIFRGIAPTHQKIDLRVVAVLSVRNGLMADARLYYDAAGLLRQLGTSSSCEPQPSG